MSRVCFLAVLISFCLSAFLGPLMIPYLKKMRIGQTVRGDGPSAHLVKNGTPTMGGLLILLSVTVTTLLFLRDYTGTTPVLLLTVGFGMVGFLDDYIKVVCRRSMGLTPIQKSRIYANTSCATDFVEYAGTLVTTIFLSLAACKSIMLYPVESRPIYLISGS